MTKPADGSQRDLDLRLRIMPLSVRGGSPEAGTLLPHRPSGHSEPGNLSGVLSGSPGLQITFEHVGSSGYGTLFGVQSRVLPSSFIR